MLLITIPLKSEEWDEEKEEFVSSPGLTLQMEHSLVSLSKWESKWRKAFLSKNEKTAEETLDYIKCMTLTPDVPPEVYDLLTPANIKTINEYIGTDRTATFFNEEKQAKGGREIVTSELIYYWMIALQIPFECQYWHLSRLLTLVKVCNIKNAPPKKMSKRDVMSRNARLNAARKQQLNTRG